MIEVPITSRQQYRRTVSYVSRGFCIDRAGRMNHRAASRSARERPARSQSCAKSVRSLSICSRCWRDKTVAMTSRTAPSAKANEVGSGTEGGPGPNSGGADTPLNWSDIRARYAKPPILGGNINRTLTPRPARGTSHRCACNRGLNTKTSAETAPHGRRLAVFLSPRLRLRSAKQTSSPVAASASLARVGGFTEWLASGSAPPCPIRSSRLVSARSIARAEERASLESGVIVQ